MKDLNNRIAVITGGASGIGKGMVEKFLCEGMKVVIADIDEKTMQSTVEELKQHGGDVMGVKTDVSKPEDLRILAEKTLDAYGAVHVLCNNAGIGYGGSTTWGCSLEEWNWVIGVNLMGVIHGINEFIPIMQQQDTECHIVNTSSLAGLAAGGQGMYGVTKHAVVALSESMHTELAMQKSKIKVSVLCPGFINTDIHNVNKVAPAGLKIPSLDDSMNSIEDPQMKLFFMAFLKCIEEGMAPGEVGDIVVRGIKNETFYLLTHKSEIPLIKARFAGILKRKKPRSKIPQELLKQLIKMKIWKP